MTDHDAERDRYMGDAQDYAHKVSLRTGAPIRPASGRDFFPGQRVRPKEPTDAHIIGTVQASTHRYVSVLWDGAEGPPVQHWFRELRRAEG